jgi:aryl-alcohol dehydrogenase-like predicted oxidoreductase
MGGRQEAMARRFVNDKSITSAERFAAIAVKHGLDPVTFAVAWSKQHDFVASTIVGVSREDQLDPILAAADLVLPESAMKAVNAISRKIMYPMG